jgi:nitrate reductase NapE
MSATEEAVRVSAQSMDSDQTTPKSRESRREWQAFLFITVALFPILSVIIVTGYGFLIWIMQLIFGPPGPPV